MWGVIARAKAAAGGEGTKNGGRVDGPNQERVYMVEQKTQVGIYPELVNRKSHYKLRFVIGKIWLQ